LSGVARGVALKIFGLFVATWLLLVIVGLTALFAALRKPDIPFETLQAKYANPASRYMNLPGGLHVHYRDQGRRDGPTLVLVHGYLASLDAWEPWFTRMGTDFRIITLDLPGHGLTRAPDSLMPSTMDYVAVVDQVTVELGVERFVLGGNSMGGNIAWAYALAHPKKLEGLILVDAAGWPHALGGGADLMSEALSHLWLRRALGDTENSRLIAKGLRNAYGDPALVTPELLTRYLEMARAPGHREILLGLVPAQRETATRERLAKLQTPTLILQGRDDKVVPFADGKAFAEAIPHATFIAYDGVGHIPMEQIPDRTAADVCAWLSDEVWPEKGSCGFR
jgi:pimeloyl-ACP methyl ester carboxylesterase